MLKISARASSRVGPENEKTSEFRTSTSGLVVYEDKTFTEMGFLAKFPVAFEIMKKQPL